MTDEIDGISSEEYVELAEIIATRNETRKLNTMSTLLASQHGRELMYDLLALCGVYQAPPPGKTDLVRAVGRQDVGREILEKVFTSDPAAYSLMSQEHAHREETDARELDTMVEDLIREAEEDD